MAQPILPADRTTSLARNTVHEQYEGKALGFYMLNNLVPIVLNVRQPGGTHIKGVLLWDRVAQKHIPYSDLGLMEKDCQKVYTFNIRHYIKCFLPKKVGSDNAPTEPYTYNLCQRCGVAIADGNGVLVKKISKRSYRRNAYIYQPQRTLQDDTGTDNIVSYQERANTCKTPNHS